MYLNILGAIIALCGCIVFFDARRLVKKYFNFGEENDATKGLKILGLVVLVVGGFMMI